MKYSFRSVSKLLTFSLIRLNGNRRQGEDDAPDKVFEKPKYQIYSR